MKESGWMHSSASSLGGRGALWRRLFVVAGLVSLLAAPLAWATNTDCDGNETDAGGYTCNTSAVDSIPDISATGTVVTGWRPKGSTGDDGYKVQTLGANFTWYGNTYGEVYVGSNGYLSFGTGYAAEVSEESIPSATDPDNAIYVYGDDLDPSSGGDVRFLDTNCDLDGDTVFDDACFVVQWTNVPTFDADATVTARVALVYASGQAVAEVDTESGAQAGTTPRLVGTENSSGSAGLWYKSGTDVDSRGATAGTRIVFEQETSNPSVTTTVPADNATDVALSASVTINFDEPMNQGSVSLTVLAGTDPGGWSPTWNSSTQVVYTHSAFSDSETIALRVTGTDSAGNALTNVNNTSETCSSGYCWDFSTVDLTAPGDVTKLTSTAGDLNVTLEWVASTGGPAGYLVLRKQGAPVDAAPTDGTSYAVFDVLGVGNEVICNGAGTSCNDIFVSNNNTYYYSVFARDAALNYAGAVTGQGIPRSGSSFKFGYKTGSSTLSPVGVIANKYIVGTGNDRLLHRMAAADGTRGSWVPTSLGGAVQSRPMVGDIDLGAGADDTAFMTAQNGYVYRVSLDDGTTDGSADVITQAGCGAGFLQAGPVVMLEDIGDNSISGDQGVIVATRCGSTNNQFQIWSLDLSTLQDSYTNAEGNGQIGISNGSPLILYRYVAAQKNLVYFPVRDAGGESLLTIAIDSNGDFEDPAYAANTGLGDIDAAPEFVRRGSDRTGWALAVGNTAGDLYLLSTTSRDGGALSQRDSYTLASNDGAVKGISASTGVAVSPTYENWVVWTTDNKVHGIKVATTGSFDDATYWSVNITGPSAPLTLRGVGGTADTRVYVGSSDGRLYELDPTDNGAIVSSPLIESGKTIGDPTFDFADGSSQGVVVGSTSGTFHWVVID